MRIADQNTATIGAYHTADVPYWSGTFDAFNLFRTARNWGLQDRALSDTMMGALIAMADTGSPSPARFAWPAWTPAQQNFAALHYAPQIQSLNVDRMAWIAAHPAAALAATSKRSPATRD